MGVKKKVKMRAGGVKIGLMLAFDEFIEEKELTVVEKTIANYRQSFGYFVDFNDLGADTTLEEIKSPMFYGWIRTMQLEGISVGSINHYLRDVSAFFNWCYEVKGYLDEKITIEKVKGQEEPPKAFSKEDIDALRVKPNRGDSFRTWRTWAIINWVYGTGNRARTVCEVKISDVDFKGETITLRHTKNKKAQNIPLSPSLATVLKEYMRNAEITGEWLFPNIADEQLTTSALRQSFQKYCSDRGVEQTNIHGLRHSFAINWIANGGNQYILQNILGHSTVAMTSRYVRLSVEETKKNFEQFNPLDVDNKRMRRTSAHKKH